MSSGAPISTIRPDVVRKVELARSFFGLARSASRSPHDLNLYVSVNHLQDAVEIFLFAVADHLTVSLKEKGGFDGYFESINARTGGQLPFRPRLNALNKTRVNSKHYAVQPDRREVQEFVTVSEEFFIEVSRSLLGVEFDQISLVHLISRQKICVALENAQQAFAEKRYKDALIETRKAFYHEFEEHYDISIFEEQETPSMSFAKMMCPAPAFAKSADYIAKSVKDPTDFIALDHSKVDADLSKAGISHTMFWNVWRTTPPVYQKKDGDEWFVKGEFRVLEENGIRERAEYALHSTIELCLTAQRNREATRSGPYGAWTIRIRPGEVWVYEKADPQSNSKLIPQGIDSAIASSWVNGLDGRTYWHVFLDDSSVFGFVLEEDLIFASQA